LQKSSPFSRNSNSDSEIQLDDYEASLRYVLTALPQQLTSVLHSAVINQCITVHNHCLSIS